MGDIEQLRARARAGAGLKVALGLAFLGVFGGALALFGSSMPVPIQASIVVLGLAQAGFLGYRAARQLQVARGDVCEATVLEVREHGTGTTGQRAMTCVLQLDVEPPGEGGGVMATSTNVVSLERGRALQGQRVRVLWNPRIPADAYAIVEAIVEA